MTFALSKAPHLAIAEGPLEDATNCFAALRMYRFCCVANHAAYKAEANWMSVRTIAPLAPASRNGFGES